MISKENKYFALIRDNRGAALLVTIWVGILLSIIVSTIVLYSLNNASKNVHLKKRIQMLYTAESTFVYAMDKFLNEHSSTLEVEFPISYTGTYDSFSTRVQIYPEWQKIDLGNASDSILYSFYEWVTQNKNEGLVKRLTDQTLDWIDEDNIKRPFGAETNEYISLGMGDPINRLPFDIEELQGIVEINQKHLQCFSEVFTPFQSRFHLPSKNNSRAFHQFRNFLAEKDIMFPDASLLAASGGYAGQVFDFLITINDGNISYHHSVIARILDSNHYEIIRSHPAWEYKNDDNCSIAIQ